MFSNTEVIVTHIIMTQ